jgi:hypothetical protein
LSSSGVNVALALLGARPLALLLLLLAIETLLSSGATKTITFMKVGELSRGEKRGSKRKEKGEREEGKRRDESGKEEKTLRGVYKRKKKTWGK